MCSTNVGPRPIRCHTCWSIPSAVQRRADKEGRSKEDRNVGFRNKPSQLSSWTRTQTNQAEIGQQPKGEKSPPAVRQHATKTSCLSKTYAGNQPMGCLPTSSRQACPPHSTEESYIGQVSTQYDSITFCKGCSARDTRPQNCIQLKFTLLDCSLLFQRLKTKSRVRLSLSPGKPNSPRLLSLVDGLSQLLENRMWFS